MIKAFLRFIGVARGDLDKIIGKYTSLHAELHAHAAHAASDAQDHFAEATRHNEAAAAANDEAKRALAIAENFSKLLAA